MDDQGLEDAAILLISMGEEGAADVFRHLTPKEVQSLGEKIARTKSISRDRYERVLVRFEEQVEEEGLIELGLDTDDYVSNVLHRALGNDKAKLLLDRIIGTDDAPGIENLKWMDAVTVAELLRLEHPQIVAVILVHLEPDQVSAVLRRFPEAQRNEVMIRLATLDGVQPAALQELSEVLSKVLAGGSGSSKSNLGGIKTAAEVLNHMGTAVETSVLDYIRSTDVELAQKITDNMFTFDDLMRVDDRGIQTVLKEVQSESLLVALKGATEELREKVFRNMSSRAAEMLREDLASRGPVRVAEVEAEQKAILAVVRRLSDDGQIAMTGGGDGQFL